MPDARWTKRQHLVSTVADVEIDFDDKKRNFDGFERATALGNETMRHMYHTSWRRSRKRRLCLPASPSGRRSWRNLSGPARVIFEKAWRWLGDVLAPSKKKGMGERREGDPQLIVLGLVLSSKAV